MVLLLYYDVGGCLELCSFFFVQAEDGIRVLVRSRGLGDVYKRQVEDCRGGGRVSALQFKGGQSNPTYWVGFTGNDGHCLLYTSDAADERSSVDLGGRRIIKKKRDLRHAVAATIINRSNLRGHTKKHTKKN